MLDIYSCFSKYTGLTQTCVKVWKCENCEIAWIGSLKGDKLAVCGITHVNLKVHSIKTLGIHFSYITKLSMEKNVLTAISNIQKVLKIKRMRKITLEVKIIVFKRLTLSKIVYLSLTSVVPKQIIEEIENIQKIFQSEPISFEK